MNKPDRAMRWPYGIAFSFVLIVALIIGTIIVASNNAVEQSDLYMSNYHEIDDNKNKIIMAEIAFNKFYTIEYVTEKLDPEATVIAYSLSDKAGNPVNHAKIKVVVTRPNTHDFDVTLENPSVSDGRYEFASIELPKEGRWDIMAQVSVGDHHRYYNLKADTRQSNTFEY